MNYESNLCNFCWSSILFIVECSSYLPKQCQFMKSLGLYKISEEYTSEVELINVLFSQNNEKCPWLTLINQAIFPLTQQVSLISVESVDVANATNLFYLWEGVTNYLRIYIFKPALKFNYP